MIFKESIYILLTLITLTYSTHLYSAEYIDIGFRGGLVIETAVNIDSFIYVVSERTDDYYSYGAGVGYQGNYYSGLIAISQVVGEVKEYKTEFQFGYNDGYFNCFGSIGLQTEKTSLLWKLGAGYPINEKTSLTTYVSSKGFFLGIRRTL